MYKSLKRANARSAKALRRVTVSALGNLSWDRLAPKSVKKPKAKAVSSKGTRTRPLSQTAQPAKLLTCDILRSALTKTPRDAAYKTDVYTCEHGTRSYDIYVPSVAKTAIRPLPVIVMLHGCNQTPNDLARGTGMNVLAEELGFLVIYPAQARRSQTNRCWNWFKTSDQTRGAGEPALIASMTRHLLGAYQADPAQVYIAGLSAGASAALVAAIAYPDIFAAVGVHSGLAERAAHDATSALVAMKYGSAGHRHATPLPTISFHGEEDKVVNPRNGRSVMARAIEPYQGLRRTEKVGHTTGGRRYVRTSHRRGKGRSFVEHWALVGTGHAWSGGNKAGGYTDPFGPDASREMLRFFLKHRTTKKWRDAIVRERNT